jgi:hypothetical protein
MIGSLDTRDRSFLFSRPAERPLGSADIDLVVFDGDPVRGPGHRRPEVRKLDGTLLVLTDMGQTVLRRPPAGA